MKKVFKMEGDIDMNHAKTYRTRQQTAILNYIQSVGEGYVTVSQIAEHFRENDEAVGMTTIYRHLEKFQKEGIVQKIMLDGNSGACYQYIGKNDDNSGQFLLKCEDCGDIINMGCNHMNDLYLHVLKEHHFNVNPHRTMFYGTCEKCLYNKEGKENKNEDGEN